MNTIIEDYNGRPIGHIEESGGGNLRAYVYPKFGGIYLVGEYDHCADRSMEIKDGMYTNKMYRGSEALASFVYSAYDRS